MLIDHGCRLGATVAIADIEIESGHGVLTESALECGAAVQRFGCVISHKSILVSISRERWGHSARNLRVENALKCRR
jgi:hypothetical protein